MIITICLYTKFKTGKYVWERNSESASVHLGLQVQGQFLGLILYFPGSVGPDDP